MAGIHWHDRPEFGRSAQLMERLQREMNRIFPIFRDAEHRSGPPLSRPSM